MSEILNDNDDFSESKILDLDVLVEDESIDDESPEVGWNSEDEKKYYSKTINIDTIEEETIDELNKEEKKEDLEIDKLINKQETNDDVDDEVNTNIVEKDENQKSNVWYYGLKEGDEEKNNYTNNEKKIDEPNNEDENNKSSNKTGFLGFIWFISKYVCELFDSFITPFYK